MAYEIVAGYLDLSAIARSGQVFRMYETEPGRFDIYSSEKHLKACRQAPAEQSAGACSCRSEKADEAGSGDDRYLFYCSSQDLPYWKRYFDLDRDYFAIEKKLDPEDRYLSGCCMAGRGIRILRQDTWEMMISFIISQQKQIPSIRKCIEGLCGKLGTRMHSGTDDHEWYAFPTAEQIASAGPDGVKGLSLGYRERYIYETAVQYLDHGISDEELSAMPYEDAKKYLLSFTGIGEKVANCILLFGAGFVDAFPIDTHIKDILYREYYLPNLGGKTLVPQEKMSMGDYEKLTSEYFGRYKGYRGIVQQWIFASEVSEK